MRGFVSVRSEADFRAFLAEEAALMQEQQQ
jgi:hypothetical protein